MRGLAVRKAALGAAGKTGEAAPELGIMRVCQHRDDPAECGMCIASEDSVRARPSWGSSGTRTHACSPSPGGQKNGLRNLRACPARVVRPQAARRVRDLGCGDLRIYLEVEVRRVPCPALWPGEAGTARLPGRHPMHQVLRLLRGPASSGTTAGRAGRAASSSTAGPPSSGNACGPTRSSPR